MGNPFSNLLEFQPDEYKHQSMRRSSSAHPHINSEESTGEDIGTESSMFHSYTMMNLAEPFSSDRNNRTLPYDTSITPLTDSYSSLPSLDTSSIPHKSNDDIRKQLLLKLQHSGILKEPVYKSPIPSLESRSIIVFDWDDTLLCTTYINSHPDFDDLEPSTKDLLSELETLVKELLDLAVSKGNVFIITNSVKGWVENSSHQYLPSCVPLLDKLKIISARSNYENKYPNNLYRWKVNAFLEIYNLSKVKDISNLICVGDSYMELEAAHKLVE